jgi:hypothetical protein
MASMCLEFGTSSDGKEVTKELQLYKYCLTYLTFVPSFDFKYLLSQFLILGNAWYPLLVYHKLKISVVGGASFKVIYPILEPSWYHSMLKW